MSWRIDISNLYHLYWLKYHLFRSLDLPEQLSSSNELAMLFTKELFKVYPTTRMLLAVQNAQMHFSSMQSVKTMEITKIKTIFAFMCNTFTLSLPQLEPVEKCKLYFVQKISFLLLLKCVTVLVVFWGENYFFSLGFSALPFLCFCRNTGRSVEGEMEGLKPFRFLFWTVLECAFPWSKPFIQTKWHECCY